MLNLNGKKGKTIGGGPARNDAESFEFEQVLRTLQARLRRQSDQMRADARSYDRIC